MSVSEDTKYTIDADSLITLFRDDERYPKKHFTSLWDNIYKMMKAGEMVSHIEVYEEIKNGGDELSKWAKVNKEIFVKYDLPAEQEIISKISEDEELEFIIHHKKQKPAHADPWLIAQAKVNGLILITEENPTSNKRIPYVCRKIGVKSMCVLDLLIEQNWKF